METTKIIGHIFGIIVILLIGFYIGRASTVKRLHDTGYIDDDCYDHLHKDGLD